MYYSVFSTPLGWMGLAGSEKGLAQLILPQDSSVDVRRLVSSASAVLATSFFDELEQRLRRYLEGVPVSFDSIEIDFSDATEFRRKVWQETRGILYGQTKSYQWLAQRVGSPGAARAVGNAMAANPVPIVVPCHRVITSGGQTGGFGGGPRLKQYLLDIERVGCDAGGCLQ